MKMKMEMKSITLKKANDTGQALVLLCLIIFLFTSCSVFVVAGLIILLVNMICPIVFKPVALLWFGLAEILGVFVSRIVLTIVFVLLVIPVGFVRILLGQDTLQLKKWKQNHEKDDGNDSVFIVRDHKYSADDIRNPY
jgi:multisubunit Na+/H+ antiporter MnhG subunit